MGTLVTFYSWKGGVGRTMALANVAVQLARRGDRVLMADWDLEAPGLVRYFVNPEQGGATGVTTTNAIDQGGLIGLLTEAAERSRPDSDLEAWRSRLIQITVPPVPASSGGAWPTTLTPMELLPSGYGSANYAEKLANFSWATFFAERHGGEWLESLRAQWAENYDFVLIDSRTGLTDSGGVCTIQMPDMLVLVFTANDQSLQGGLQVVESAQKARANFAYDRGQLSVIPLLSRWDGDSEVDLAEQWLQRFDKELAPLTSSWLPKPFTPRRLLDKTRVPHVARFSFGEPLPVLTHSLTDASLPGLYYDTIARLLHSKLADIGKIIDPTYEPSPVTGFSTAADEARMLSLVRDESKLHQEERNIRLTHGEDSREFLAFLTSAGAALMRLARFPDAERFFRRALAIEEKNPKPDDPGIAILINNLAQLLHETNRLAEAEPLMRRALAIDEASPGSDQRYVAIRLRNLASLLQDTNRLAEAEPLMRRALAIDEVSYGPAHPEVAICLNNLAQVLRATNRLAEAEPLMRRALAIDEAHYGPDNSNVAIRLNNLARLLQITNRFAEAEPLFRRSLAIDEARYGPDHPDVAIRLSNLAGLLRATNRLAEAEPMMRRALAINEANYGPDHPNVAISLNNLAELLQATNRLAEAEPLFRRAVEIFHAFNAQTGHEHPHFQTTRENFRQLRRTQRGAGAR